MKNRISFIIKLLIMQACLLIFSLFWVYGSIWVNFGSEKGRTLISEDALLLEGVKKNKAGLYTAKQDDPKIFVEVPENTRYVQINLSGVQNNDTKEWTCYYPNQEGAYSEQQTVHTALRDGNGIFYFRRPVQGTLRFDPGEKKGIKFYLDYIKCGDHAYVASEWIIVLAVLEILFIAALLLYIFRTKVREFYGKYKGECNVFLGCFLVFFLWSILLPWNGGPDEKMRFEVAQYIYRFNRLPRGDDPILCTTNVYGTSYAFSPYLSYLLSVVLMKISSAFGGTNSIVQHSARLISVLCMTSMSVIMYQIGKKIKLKYPWFLPMLICLWPEIGFLSSYINSDAMAIMASAIVIYAWFLGTESMWNWKSCVYLSIGMAFCVSSYYNVYPYLLFSFLIFVFDYVRRIVKEKNAKPFINMMGKGIVILLITGLTSGWWFVRNFFIYNGDFTGGKADAAARIKYASMSPELLSNQNLYEKGVSLYTMLMRQPYEWVRWTKKSFVGGFLHMQLFLEDRYVNICLAILLLGIAAAFVIALFLRKTRMGLKMNIFLGCSVIMAGSLAVIYSYCFDYQPQGRYVMPAMVPLMIWSAVGWDKIGRRIKNQKLLAVSVCGIVGVVNFVSLVFYILLNCYWN